ncbi:SDR family oxidoreductase [Marihabitans asiaticum]|nr:SDR family oxidoreductase [Marihabitans asiaticum]
MPTHSTQTDMCADPDFQASVRSGVPAARLGSPREAAEALWWLASPQASYVVGNVLTLDGGWSLG